MTPGVAALATRSGLGANADTVSPYGTLHERFHAVAVTQPHAVAVRSGGRRLTYQQLDELSDRLAEKLADAGVQPGSLVALRLQRGMCIPIAILAVLKRGCAYVPIDPDYPADRQAYMLEDARVRHLIEADDPDQEAPRVVDVPQDEPAWPLPPGVAYVIYTSGSTGRPKGVVVGHRHVLSLFDAAQPHFGLGPADVFTLFHSFCFDVSVWELWGSLLYGGTLAIVRLEQAQDPAALASLLAEAGVTVLNQVPTVFGYLVRELEDVRRILPRLRAVILAGEAVDLAVVQRWRDLRCAPGARVINMYGPTETTVFTTFRELTEADQPRADGRTPIGPALRHLEARLVGDDLLPVPEGEPGELVVAGAGVTFGYLGRPDLTAQRFLMLPGSDRRWYRTGDWVMRARDGDLIYAGRRDSQVKVRGFRVELGEIEAVLREHADVLSCAVTAETNRLGENTLVAHYVPREAGGNLTTVLRAHARSKLPAQVVPVRYLRYDRLPLTGSGKIDRAALSAATA